MYSIRFLRMRDFDFESRILILVYRICSQAGNSLHQPCQRKHNQRQENNSRHIGRIWSHQMPQSANQLISNPGLRAHPRCPRGTAATHLQGLTSRRQQGIQQDTFSVWQGQVFWDDGDNKSCSPKIDREWFSEGLFCFLPLAFFEFPQPQFWVPPRRSLFLSAFSPAGTRGLNLSSLAALVSKTTPTRRSNKLTQTYNSSYKRKKFTERTSRATFQHHLPFFLLTSSARNYYTCVVFVTGKSPTKYYSLFCAVRKIACVGPRRLKILVNLYWSNN